MQCTKITFNSKKEAQAYLLSKRCGKGKDIIKKLRVYECPHCGRYHFSSKKRLKFFNRKKWG